MTHKRVKCEKASEHINVQDVEKGSLLIELLKGRKIEKTQKQRLEREACRDSGRQDYSPEKISF